MAIYLDTKCVSWTKNAFKNAKIEQVAFYDAITDPKKLYYLTTPSKGHNAGVYYNTGTEILPVGAAQGQVGTLEYPMMSNKPKINNVELLGSLTLDNLNIAQQTNTYTKVEVDTSVAAVQKAYTSTTIPTSVNNVGIYYVQQPSGKYRQYLVDSAKNVTDITSEETDLSVFQKEYEPTLDTTNKYVVWGINELKASLDAVIAATGQIYLTEGSGCTVTPIKMGDVVTGYIVSHSANITPVANIDTTEVELKFGENVIDTKFTYGTSGHFTKTGVKQYTLPRLNVNGVEQHKEESFYTVLTSGTKDEHVEADVDGLPTWKPSSTGYPIGSIIMFAGNTAPDGWMFCDGVLLQSVDANGNPTKYKPLYDVIGQTYGKGDAFGSFKLPNLYSQFIEGAKDNLGTFYEAGLPDHKHTFSGDTVTLSGGSHSHSWSQKVTNKAGNKTGTVFSSSEGNTGTSTMTAGSNGSTHSHSWTAAGTIGKASEDNSLYGKSTTVQPKSICLNYIIKYLA